MYANYQNNSINEKNYFLGIDDTQWEAEFQIISAGNFSGILFS